MVADLDVAKKAAIKPSLAPILAPPPHSFHRPTPSLPPFSSPHAPRPDARPGYATGGMAPGYKLFAASGAAVVPDPWSLGPLNHADADRAVKVIDALEGAGYILADAAHDINYFHERADVRGFQLLMPHKQPGSGLGPRSHSAARLRSIERMERPTPFSRHLYATREQIERDFGHRTT